MTNRCQAQHRLNAIEHEFFLGAPYFSPEIVAQMLDLPLSKGTLKSALQKLVQQKRERDEGDEICAVHGLAPVFKAALGF